jgi:tetratricopeptide (TPR) repeat protein
MRVGNLQQALALLHTAEKSLLMVNSTLNAAICVQDIGCIYYRQEEYSAAKAHLTKAKEKFDALGSVERLISSSYYLAWVEFREGNSQGARQILKEAKRWFSSEIGYWQTIYTRGLGEFAFQEGDEEGAAVLFAQVQEEFEAIGFTSQKADKNMREQDSEGWRWFRGGRHTDDADRVEGGGT